MGDAIDAWGAIITEGDRVRYIRFAKRMTRKGRRCIQGLEGHVYWVGGAGKYVMWVPEDEEMRPAKGHGLMNAWTSRPGNLQVVAEKQAPGPTSYVVGWR